MLLTRTLVAGVLVLAGTAVAGGAQAAASCAGLVVTIVGTQDDDRLVGTTGDDVIAGLDGIDRISGLGGDDVLCGDAGVDTLVGGAGNDRLYAGDNGTVPTFEGEPYAAGELLVPGPGDDLVDIGLNTVVDDNYYPRDVIDYSLSTTGVLLDLAAGTASGQGADTLVLPPGDPAVAGSSTVEVDGSTHADVLLGSDGHDVLIGNLGGDRIEGRGGDDLLLDQWDEGVNDSDDHFDGGTGDDSMSSAGGVDTLLGGSGDDHLREEGGVVHVDGGPGDDGLEVYLRDTGRVEHVVTGGLGADTLDFGIVRPGVARRPVRGRLDLARGVLRVWMPQGKRWTASVSSVSRVRLPSSGRWLVLGSRADETISGYDAFEARGRGGDDTIFGSYADDVLLGGAGRDVVHGRTGADRCRAERTFHCER